MLGRVQPELGIVEDILRVGVWMGYANLDAIGLRVAYPGGTLCGTECRWNCNVQ